jgi:hypothetical protein
MTFRFAVFLIAFFTSAAAWAQAAPAPKQAIAIYGHGNALCRDYLAAQNPENLPLARNYQIWLHGFISAYNTLLSPTGDVTKGRKADAFVPVLENYCQKNPQALFQRATIELLRGLEAGEY